MNLWFYIFQMHFIQNYCFMFMWAKNHLTYNSVCYLQMLPWRCLELVFLIIPRSSMTVVTWLTGSIRSIRNCLRISKVLWRKASQGSIGECKHEARMTFKVTKSICSSRGCFRASDSGCTSCQRQADCLFLLWMSTIRWPNRSLTTCTSARSLYWKGN